ncbi:MAG: murein biosynthesis integral membrane protein MurJ [Nitrospinota bacterium]
MKEPTLVADQKLSRSTILVSIAIFASRILGYIRDLVIASVFGANYATDAFVLAFRIPNMLRQLTAEGAMTKSFIPTLSKVDKELGRYEAMKFTGKIITLFSIFSIMLLIVLEIFTESLVLIVAPGFANNPEQLTLAINLTRITLPYLVLISLASILSGYLNYFKIFFIPALAPVMLNISIITSALTLTSMFHYPIYALAVGVLIGGTAHLLFIFKPLISIGYRYIINFNLRGKYMKSLGWLMASGGLYAAVTQINALVTLIFASTLKAGSITFLYYANSLSNIIVGIFGASFGLVIFPYLSKESSSDNLDKFREIISYSIRVLLLIAIPAAVGLAVLSDEIVNLLFERGAFTIFDRKDTAIATVMLAVGLPATTMSHVLMSAFYSLNAGFAHLKTHAIATVLHLFLCIILLDSLAHAGLALATSITMTVSILFQLYLLRNRLKWINGRMILNSTIKALVGASVMGLTVYYLSNQFFNFEEGLITRFFLLIGIIIAGIFLYATVTLILKTDEAIEAKDFLIKRLKASLGRQ